MKLIYCRVCGDMFGLRLNWRRCTCKRVGGKYNRDGDTATVTKTAELFGFCNHLKHPGRFGDVHEDGCRNAWPYPMNNGKITIRG